MVFQAIRGKVHWTETFGSLTLTNIEVIEVFKHGQVKIDPISREILWTNTSCGTCPRLDPGNVTFFYYFLSRFLNRFFTGREYFLLGHEEASRQRLLYTNLSVGLEWRKKYALLIGV